MNKKRKNGVVILTECSIMIALSTVLSIVKLFELPYGGSITPASMLPIIIIAYRHGVGTGLASALGASLIQMLLGLNNVLYFSTWQSAIAVALLDYVVAFGVFGLAGSLRKFISSQGLSLICGTGICSLLRYACHVIAGATVWAGFSIPTEAALIYSMSYNATYMIPETIILTLATAYIGASLDLKAPIPRRKRGEKLDTVSAICYFGAGLVALSALVCDTVLVFSRLQDADSGEFSITGLSEVSWLAVGIITVSAILVAIALVIIPRVRAKGKA